MAIIILLASLALATLLLCIKERKPLLIAQYPKTVDFFYWVTAILMVVGAAGTLTL